MPISMREAVLAVFAAHSKAVVVGLTGRTGSGCTTAANILSKENFHEINAKMEIDHIPDKRKQSIVLNYAQKNWHPFYSISVSSVISTYLLDEDPASILTSLQKLPHAGGRANQIRATEISKHLEFQVNQRREAWLNHKKLLQDDTELQLEAVEDFFKYYDGEVVAFYREVRNILGSDVGRVLQHWGDNLRASGNPYSGDPDPANFFVLPERLCAIKRLREFLLLRKGAHARIVIDALRNPFELTYLKQRIPEFIVIGITTDDEDRKRRLALIGNTAQSIDALDQKEYPEKNKPLAGYKQFVSQNIQACLEKADIFIHNPGHENKGEELDLRQLSYGLAKYVTLRLHPGLITPSRDERCMQLAFVARANSGCISRQVGAVVTNAGYSVKALGWNDVPLGQVPCLLRDVDDLLKRDDDAAFSAYETTNKNFRDQLGKNYSKSTMLSEEGLGCPFCFKDEYNSLKKDTNQVHTRSLHAEENAFLQLSKYGSEGIVGGVLYSTASPCELCAKKAFQLGIRRIVYVDPYPGISTDHVLASGPKESRPKLELFSGAVGYAYHRLYDPILPVKDELRARMTGGAVTEPTSAQVGLFITAEEMPLVNEPVRSRNGS